VLVDLVQTTTRDGVRLDGTYQAPERPGGAGLGADAFCLVHGTGGSFYSSTLFDDLAEALLALGCGVLRVNTRGHDLMSSASTPRGPRRLGAAYEVVDECRHDLSAWAAWLRDRAGPRVGLVGHSLGAVKVLYALAHEPGVSAACALALSPPRLSYSSFRAGARAAEFLETFGRAQALVSAGEPDALLDVRLPLPFVVTAGGYVEKYGPDERYNYLRFAGRLPCPTLFTFGSAEVEQNIAFRGAPEEVRALAGRHPDLGVEIIPGADHFYTGVRDELIAGLVDWLKRLNKG
jgi:pimeloyl-ACP methyl ester carboxylesterase